MSVPSSSRARSIAVTAAVVALSLLWLAMFFEGTGDVDKALLGELYGGHRPALADAARLLTLLGGWYFVTPLVAAVTLVFVFRKQPWLAFVLFVGNTIGRLLVEFQKYELGRMRPDQNPHLVNVYSLSFPSAHSANSVMTYVVLAQLLVADPERRLRWTIAAVVLAFVIGLSRVILGVHWPSDVIAGWSFGALWALIMLWFAWRAPRSVRAEGRAQ